MEGGGQHFDDDEMKGGQLTLPMVKTPRMVRRRSFETET
jgi:hypothetical protein